MAISIVVCKEALNYHMLGFFNDIHSVMDMGDQDLGVPYSLFKEFVSQSGLKLDEKVFERAKHFPERPRVSSSEFWRLLGIKTADRMDLTSIERINEDDQKAVIIKDLNETLDDKSMWGKYDLVTDFGNNEHPFNIVEAYRTMHRLTSKNGYMWISQEVFGGNGFYNLDRPFFENLAAANNYEIFNAAYIISISNGESFYIPCEEGLLSMINFGKVKSIGITYIFRKSNSNDFIVPYQGSVRDKPNGLQTYYKSSISVHDQSFLVRNYIPTTIDSLSGRALISELLKRLKNKTPLFR